MKVNPPAVSDRTAFPDHSVKLKEIINQIPSTSATPVPEKPVDLTGVIEYAKGLFNEAYREGHAKTFSSGLPDYVAGVEYASPKKIEYLRDAYHNFVPNPLPISIVVPVEGKLGEGARSIVYITSEAYPEWAKEKSQLYENVAFTVSNNIKRSSLLIAKFYNQGINYQTGNTENPVVEANIRDFFGQYGLFIAAAQMLGIHSEFNGIFSIPQTISQFYYSLNENINLNDVSEQNPQTFLASRAIRIAHSTPAIHERFFTEEAISIYRNPSLSRLDRQNGALLIEMLQNKFHPIRLFPIVNFNEFYKK